ncbi:MAG: STAS domain-containing protein [Gammaproteobacteria bacterium]|nr:STAS domain-containing protein [Gammaproteobacteria bacterium]
MAAKKSAKKVIDHDPLAWLDEEQDSEAAAPRKKAAGKKKKSARPVSARTKVENKVQAVEESEVPDASENINYGFFQSNNEISESVKNSDSTGSAEVVSLGETLTVKTVAECKKNIVDSMTKNAEITLDSASLQKIDTAGLQLLLSLQKSLALTQQQINWKNRNPVIDSAARLTGMTEIIEEASTGYGFF